MYLFTGAGNNFVVLDGRQGDMAPYRKVSRIVELCREYKTDGLMILTVTPDNTSVTPDLIGGLRPDFVMEFYNPDGSGGMMCGNGGRCIVAFADMLGLKPTSPDGVWHFLAPDGPHTATILKRPGQQSTSWTVRLKMLDVKGVTTVLDGLFLNTGTRHFVKFVDDVDAIDVEAEGNRYRWDPAFQPVGTNVNFVQIGPDGLHVRTFEKGVEGETLACGTGLTASALAFASQHPAANTIDLQCRRGDWLSVEFTPALGHDSAAGLAPAFTNVFLTGPAECLGCLDSAHSL